MEKINKYKQIVTDTLSNRCVFPSKQFPNLRDHLIIDEQKTHFILLTIGWDKQEYIHQVLRHVEVKGNGKIWIHENRTDSLLDELLIKNGINKSNIIAGMIEQYLIDENSAKAA